MSVGLQRLREDAETDPPGRDRQGGGTRRSSTEALAVDARRRELLPPRATG